MDVGAWVWKNFDYCSGISFLPHSDHTYQQAPYQDCTANEYETMLAKMPPRINWSDLRTTSQKTTPQAHKNCPAQPVCVK